MARKFSHLFLIERAFGNIIQSPHTGCWLRRMMTNFTKEVDLCRAHLVHLLNHLLGHTFSSGWGPDSDSQFLLLEDWEASSTVQREGHADPSLQEPDSSPPNAGTELASVPSEENGEEVQWRPGWELPCVLHYLERLPGGLVSYLAGLISLPIYLTRPSGDLHQPAVFDEEVIPAHDDEESPVPVQFQLCYLLNDLLISFESYSGCFFDSSINNIYNFFN